MRCLNNAPDIGLCIEQVNTKMSEDFHDENRKSSLTYFVEQELDSAEEVESGNSNSGEESSDETSVTDHMYHSSDTNIIDVNTASSYSHTLKQQDLTSSAAVTSGGCQTLESEVKFIKEWLILHTDLIQQQNDDILDKDREIYLLRKENEMLRERILCIEKGIPTQFAIPLVPSGNLTGSAPLLNQNYSTNLCSNCNQKPDTEKQNQPIDDQQQAQLETNSETVGIVLDMTQGPCRPCSNNNIANCTKETSRTSIASEGACVLEEKGPAVLVGCDQLTKVGIQETSQAEVTANPQQGEQNSISGCKEVVEEEEEDCEFEKSGSFGDEAKAEVLQEQQLAANTPLQLESVPAAAPSDIASISVGQNQIPTHASYSISISAGESLTAGGANTVATAATTTAFLGGQEPTGTGPHRPHRGSRRLSRGLKMSIRRKRASSGGGGADNHRQGATTVMATPPAAVEPTPLAPDTINHHNNSNTYHQRRYKKRKRRSTKDVQMLTTTEPYFTQAHDVTLGIALPDPDIPHATATLEVPRWRHKIYASLYTMEGTENLDDEVFNKRHLRLENDERRRKRWDVQRIREQRVIEKLKQRQERVSFGYCGGGDGTGTGGGGGSGCCNLDHDHKHQLHSLWPSLDDVRYLEVCERLPVAAFGLPMPRLQPSEFSLPWLTNPSYLQRRPTIQQMARRPQIRRRSAKR